MRFKSSFVNALLVALSLGVSLVAAEVGLRLAGYESRAQTPTKIGRERVMHPLPGIRYLLPGNASYSQAWPSDPRGYFDPGVHSITYRTNNYGFRDSDFAIARNERVRVAFVGDSFCWGTGVRSQDRFSDLIAQWLNRDAILGEAFEVYNFCLPGFNTAGEAALYEQVVGYFQPDILVIAYFLNDVNVPPDLYFQWRVEGPGWLRDWRRHSRFVDLVFSLIGALDARPEFIRSVNAAYREGHPGLASVAAGFERIGALNGGGRVPTLLAIFPWISQLEANQYPFEEAHRTIAALGRQNGFAVLDLRDAFYGHDAEALWVHPGDHHPNDTGHRIAAQALYPALTSQIIAQGDRLLRDAQTRRGTPVPPLVAAPPGKHWYLAFRQAAGRGAGS